MQSVNRPFNIFTEVAIFWLNFETNEAKEFFGRTMSETMNQLKDEIRLNFKGSATLSLFKCDLS